MTATMAKAALIDSLKMSLMDSASHFLDEYDALLATAAEDLARVRRRTLIGSLTLAANQTTYEAPADLLEYKYSTWGEQRQQLKPWQPGYPRRLPSVMVTDSQPKQLVLSVAPAQSSINLLGSTFKFFYFASHHLDDDASKTTVAESERGLLLLRAQAEAMKYLAMRNIDKTVSTKHAVSGASKGGTPTSLYQLLMDDWERRAAC